MKLLKWAAGGVALLVVSGAIAFGVASAAGVAQAQETPSEQRTRYEELIAQKLGVTTAQLETARKGARDQMVDEALARGAITQEQADRIKSGEPGEFRGDLRQRMGGKARGVIGNVMQAAADVLGLSKEDLRTQLGDQTLAQLAASKGISPDALKSGMTDKVKTQLQTAVTNGTITQAQADEMLSRLSERLDDVINKAGKGEMRPAGAPTTPGGSAFPGGRSQRF